VKIVKALHVRQWGGSDAAVFEETERPQPGPGEILVRIKATSINPMDWKIREGYLHEYLQLPLVLGSDFAGDIEALGEGVEGFEVGTAVYGMKGLRGGTYAEYTTALPNDMGKKPTTLSYAEAAAVPHTAVTALSMLEEGELKEGQRVLIHAAAGGVGHFAVQLAKLKGAYVIGTASEQNAAFLKELGVDEVVNYSLTPFETVVKDVDLVLDTQGFDVAARSLQVLKPGGTIVGIVTPAPAEAAAEKQIQVKFIGGAATTEKLTEIANLIDSGKLKPHVDQSISFEKIHDALQLSQQGHVRGKVVVTMS
jgi:NADPH:quinone reductase-like Zn-dependent oxidoreductase